MSLPAELLLTTAHDGHRSRAAPRYLTARDEVWVRAVVDRFDGYVGRTVRDREAELPDRVRAIARQHGVSIRAADGLTHVLCRRFKAKVDSPIEPREARAVVFEEAGLGDRFDRADVLRRSAAKLGIDANQVATALFADRPGARRIHAPAQPLSATEAVEAYNLALVQGLLMRSERVTVEVKEHVRAVVRFAKLTGLLCTYAFGDSGTRLEVSGPLSILRHTTKYGLALASFFPAVVSTPGFHLEAHCILRGEPVNVHIEASDRIARTHKLPRDADSATERALARDVRRIAGPWTLAREANAIAVGSRASFPDFTLSHRDGYTVLVEVVGFYTPEYLRSKLEALRAAAVHPLIVCVDESLACGEGEVPGTVLRFKRRMDAVRLLEAAEGLRRGISLCFPAGEAE